MPLHMPPPVLFVGCVMHQIKIPTTTRALSWSMVHAKNVEETHGSFCNEQISSEFVRYQDVARRNMKHNITRLGGNSAVQNPSDTILQNVQHGQTNLTQLRAQRGGSFWDGDDDEEDGDDEEEEEEEEELNADMREIEALEREEDEDDEREDVQESLVDELTSEIDDIDFDNTDPDPDLVLRCEQFIEPIKEGDEPSSPNSVSLRCEKIAAQIEDDDDVVAAARAYPSSESNQEAVSRPVPVPVPAAITGGADLESDPRYFSLPSLLTSSVDEQDTSASTFVCTIADIMLRVAAALDVMNTNVQAAAATATPP